jgi:serine/threonine-protein kinase
VEPLIADRYEDRGLLGMGAMGEVRRVRDTVLHRTVALKILRPELVGKKRLEARFLAEAQVTAQLQHPGVVPVHDQGRLPDGRYWFTMPEIRGRTLGACIAEVHAASGEGSWGTAASGWTLRRLVDAFAQVCAAVGAAHARGVVHRDIKPDNIMVGAFSEVLVVDWGIARVLGGVEVAGGDEVETTSAVQTRVGTVTGTPAYMAPEQARGEVTDRRSDVYALGAVLYEILTGRPPFTGETAAEVLERVRTGGPAPLGRRRQGNAPAPPAGLVELCERAMEREADDRPADATALADGVRAWLEGSRDRERAVEMVERARALEPEAAALRVQATALRAQAHELLREIAPSDNEARKAPAWALQDDAEAREREAQRLDVHAEQLLHGALVLSPGLIEAHLTLAERHRRAHHAAEEARDPAARTRAEALLRASAEALPLGHPRRVQHLAWLDGDGLLTLLTDPPGAEVHLERYEPFRRRLQAVPLRVLGKTPLRRVPLHMGSYRLRILAPGCAPVLLPVFIGRGEHWDNAPPGARLPAAVPLPPADAVGPGEVYVPAGWTTTGGDPGAPQAGPRRRRWIDGFILQQSPVTLADWAAFLAVAEDPAPLLPAAAPGGAAPFGPGGALAPGVDPRLPVTGIPHAAALAYAAHHAATTGLPWALPGQWAWEKAARGGDGRLFPWGDAFDPSWCALRDGIVGPAGPQPSDRFPVDESPYGVRGLAGNVRDWSGDARFGPDDFDEGARVAPTGRAGLPGSPVLVLGGAWSDGPAAAHLADRRWAEPTERAPTLGLRLLRPWPPPGRA